ncbi:FAD-dependent oxidoreductase [Neomoorella mulderi]|uniref:Electron transfer flavoprotein-ubiquinone oxidoreductase n=1 Tax=Moorella mulderi DSM 14980 TaxID=1122241 RepID=A0A151AVM0_9FIRM|nr:FAD-dependent oxidoreductase [Moorella mulderi]KYH31688.1 electron transfer flavoprotein-ubiquinone oxidoreductase [Moorella mulderi DSM 14980]
MVKHFDVIVVGAGLAGSAAALTMSRSGLNVCLIERATSPGEKNVTGGVLYGRVLDDLITDWQNKAPVERWIVKNGIGMITSKSLTLFQFETEDFYNPPYNSCTINRANFDLWLAQQAEEAGATLVTNTLVEDLIFKDGYVKGVKTQRPDGELEADIVICADGVNSLLAQKAGLRKKDISPHEVGIGIKEVLLLPIEKINERFGLEENQGSAYEFIGTFLNCVHGGAFLYTNKKTLSLGIVVNLGSLQKAAVQPSMLLEEFKGQPQIQKFIEGGTLVEYSAHMVPEIGLEMVPKLYGNGVMVAGDAAGFVVTNGFTFEGMNYALASGKAAGHTAVLAMKNGDVSAKALAAYQDKINESFIGKNLETYRKVYHVLGNPRLRQEYPQIIEEIAKELFLFDDKPRIKLAKMVRSVVGNKVSMWQVIRDGIDMWRYM